MFRIHVGDAYGDIPRGVFVVRGENVVLLGEIEENEEAKKKLREVSLNEILEKQTSKIGQEQKKLAKLKTSNKNAQTPF